MGGLGEPHPGYSASAQKSRIPPKSMSRLWHRVQPICDIGCRALSSPRPSLPLLCTHPGKLAGKPGGSLFGANQEFKHASPSPREGTFLPTRAPNHSSKPTSFPYSLTPFSDLLATRLALPRGPQYVSQKPFHTLWVQVWHHQFQHPNQIWDERKVHPPLWGLPQAPPKLRIAVISRVNDLWGELWFKSFLLPLFSLTFYVSGKNS